MNLLLKILFFVLTIFQTNICEAKVVVFAGVILETIFSNTLNSGKSNLELKRVFSRNDLANTCKNDSGLVDYRNRGISTARVAAKTGTPPLAPDCIR
ncbi:hypothetical protein [Gynurincola endophyticus]|uniref:hypothetical protein n=1 Tax=Gynurincola endophyticus TaxID=2479004 RepID=UPI000F8D00D4|nr:hypothetical protein [Gynurincola endophyticus]